MEVIQLTQGFTALVDKSSVPMLVKHSWHVSKKGSRPVAQASIRNPHTGKYKSVMMHRFLLDAPDGSLVDHINGNTLDNRIENLRLATHKENSRNRFPSCACGYTGVRKVVGGWVAMIAPPGMEISLGVYGTPEKAAAAYNAAALLIFGEFAKPNKVETIDGILEAVIAKKRASVSRLLSEIDLLTRKGP